MELPNGISLALSAHAIDQDAFFVHI